MAYLTDTSAAGITQLKPRIDADGKIWLRAYAAGGATRKTKISIQLHQYGWQAKAIADTSDVQLMQYIAFPKATYTSGQYGWFQIGGHVSDAIITTTTGTVGHGVKIATDTIVSTGASVTGNDNIFGVFTATGVSGVTHNILLFPERVSGAD